MSKTIREYLNEVTKKLGMRDVTSWAEEWFEIDTPDPDDIDSDKEYADHLYDMFIEDMPDGKKLNKVKVKKALERAWKSYKKLGGY